MMFQVSRLRDSALGRRRVVFAVALAAASSLALAASPAFASATGQASAYGESVDLDLVPLLGGGVPINSGPTPTTSGTAPAAFNNSQNLASVSVSGGATGQILSTGLLAVTATSNAPTTDTASATATVTNPSLFIVGSLVTRLLTLNATQIQATASITGSCGALSGSGTTTLNGASVGGTIGAGLSVPGSPAPNTTLVNLLGIRVVLNEQILTGNGTTNRRIQVNAVHVTISNAVLSLIGALSGDIVISHAEAQVTCDGVPTPTPTPTPTAAPNTPTPPPGGPTPTPPPGGATPTPPPGGATPTPPPGGATPTPPPGGATPTPPPGGATPTPPPGSATPTPTRTPAPTPPPPPTPPGEDGEDPYTNPTGLSGDLANAALNPGGVGQVLIGALYDVRRANGIDGTTDPQHVNLSIVNTVFTGEETGGVLARVRFRESKTSREVLSFDIALSCAEVWTGAVSLDESASPKVPVIQSVQPIVTSVDASSVRTAPLLDPQNGGSARAFTVPSDVAAKDLHRGYVEVIAEERLPCEPDEGHFLPDGNVYSRLGDDVTPPNSLAGQVLIVRPLAGNLFQYDMTAITRFVVDGGGSIWSPPASGRPDLTDCVGWDSVANWTYDGDVDCRNQVELALSKGRAHVQFDHSSITAGRTLIAVTLPTKHEHCTGNGASAPFRCAAAGEGVLCRLWDRAENERFPRPACTLTRESTILEIGDPSIPTGRGDEMIDMGSFEAGWLDVDFVIDPSAGSSGVHELTGLSPAKVDFLGVGQTGFRGLPAVILSLQEHFNGRVGGVFGSAFESAYELELLPALP